MNRFFFSLICLSLCVVAPAYSATYTAKVIKVVDGDTLLTDSGEKVRLVSINAPEKATEHLPAQPLAAEAHTLLAQLVANKDVKLVTKDTAERDRYGRLLAQVYLTDGTWVNKELLRAGVAHLYTFPDTPFEVAELAAAETSAAVAKLGLWALPEWQVFNAATPTEIPLTQIGRFTVVEGQVLHAATVQDKVYLNFGTDWRDDFTVEIRKRDWQHFKAVGITDIAGHYRGKHLKIRGFLKPINGPMITATHPAQLEELPKN